MGLSLKTKIKITKINRPKAVLIKYLNIECGDILEILLSVDKNKYVTGAKAIDVINTRNGMILENYSFTLFAKNFSDYYETFEYEEL
jgi:hypothetical protein